MSYQNDGDNDDSSLFAIVGVEDDTSVSIVLTAGVTLDGVSYQGGDSLEININRYEVVQLVADSNAEYIGGSTIESDNPIAVFTGHLCASTPGSYCDTLSEQLVPVESWGTQYIYTATGTPNDRDPERRRNVLRRTEFFKQHVAFTVIVYGYEDDETYGYSAGLFLPTDERLLNIEPYFVREVGGEQLALTLPCLEENVAETHSIKCRFTTSTEATEEVRGTPIDLYNIVCITPVFHLISYVTVDVSVDDGRTFLFRGNIHVLPQHVLPPKVVVEQSGQTFGYINFNENGTIFINWISDDFFAVEWVDISVRVSFPNFGSPGFGWSLDIDIKQVENTGSFDLMHENFPLNIAPFGTSVAVFIVKPRSESVLYHLSSGFLKVLGSTSCNEWSDNRLANFMPDGLSNVPSCPCTDDQAFVDGNFQEDDSSDLTFVHEGAVLCFRSSVTSGSSGQQCCYGSDGNILVGPPAGGTADAYALHIGTIWHFWYDILPWLSCCKQESHMCSFYYEFRPSDDCSQYQPPRPTRGTGDPHFLSLDGKEFTFNGAGEFLLLKSTLHNLTFQARMEALPGTMQVSTRHLFFRPIFSSYSSSEVTIG
ncbi:putative sushi domain-containing protein 2 [Apostichopus japonicus]|uniref:Putative sushi domain-containing protein 2 n=1 Tax=Stichopus japonicus TaxID=307972 RepID=A0A2G8LAH0_STIJA|nr:putative sushi domain-containing protein 2 [Apostichopus japonicus]